jgi:hypothetical protein
MPGFLSSDATKIPEYAAFSLFSLIFFLIKKPRAKNNVEKKF